MRIKYILTTVSILIFSGYSVAQNLIASDLLEWVNGESGATTSFSQFGGNNSRILVDGPHGAQVTVWSATSTATTASSGQSGGWIHTGIDINTSKTYRIAFWMKSTGTTVCNNNAAFYTSPVEGGANVSALRIATNMSEMYWPSLYTRELPTWKWMLVIGYVYGKDTTTYDLPSGVFDPSTFDGNSAPTFTTYNYKFPNSHTALNLKLRNDLWNCQVGEVQYSYMPRIEEVNGLEPSIAELISPTLVDTASPSVPTDLVSSNIAATTATLSWSASTDDIGVTAYEVYRNNSLQATVATGTSYAITGLTAGTTYNYTITAKDAAGNTSVQSTSLTITTLSSGGTPTTGGHWTKTGTVVSYAGGKVGIGTTSPDYELTVKGKIHAEEVKIDLSVPAPDYVFKKEYKLLSLEEVQAYINKNGHLPNIPSAEVMETEGVELGAMEMKLLEKIEELTLYILEQGKDVKMLKKEIKKLKNNKYLD